ncbi:MAG: hypothetical protein WBD95_05160 [Xanthobacteraceae bacterium]
MVGERFLAARLPFPELDASRLGNPGIWHIHDAASVTSLMPRYFFILRVPGAPDHDDSDGTDLPRDASALDYAKRVIRELKQAEGYDDPNLTMIVKDDTQRLVVSIRF